MSARDERNYSPLSEMSQGGGSKPHNGITAVRAERDIPPLPRPRLSLDTIAHSMAQQGGLHKQPANIELRERTGWY